MKVAFRLAAGLLLGCSPSSPPAPPPPSSSSRSASTRATRRRRTPPAAPSSEGRRPGSASSPSSAPRRSPSTGETTYQSGGVDVLKVKDIPVQLSAMLYLIPAGPLQLYALGGVGSHFTKSEGLGPAASAPSTTQTKWAPQAGAGVEIWPSEELVHLRPTSDTSSSASAPSATSRARSRAEASRPTTGRPPPASTTSSEESRDPASGMPSGLLSGSPTRRSRFSRRSRRDRGARRKRCWRISSGRRPRRTG